MSKPIKKGDELLTSYGKGFWDGRGMLPSDEFKSNCPGRHGLEAFDIPEDDEKLCLACANTIVSGGVKFFFCKSCNYGICIECQ